MGGTCDNDQFGDVFIFNTLTDNMNRVIDDCGLQFVSQGNRCSKSRTNEAIALVQDFNVISKAYFIEFKKSKNQISIIKEF